MTRQEILKFAEILGHEHAELYHQGTNKNIRDHTLDIMAENHNMSKRTISRYLRLCNLIEHIKIGFLNNQIGFKACVQLSYLSYEQQEDLCLQLPLTCITENLAKQIRHWYRISFIGPDLNEAISKNSMDKRGGFPALSKIYNDFRLYNYTNDELEIMLKEALTMWALANPDKIK